MKDRVQFTPNGELDEIVAARGGHLERLSDHGWFLELLHSDGTSTAIWFTSKDLKRPMMETRAKSQKEKC